MSGIGDYIHYTTINYINYGTAHKGQPPRFAQSAIDLQKAHLRTAIRVSSVNGKGIDTKGNNNTANRLIDQISFLFRPPDERILSQLGLNSNIYKDMWDNVLMPIFKEKFIDAETRISQQCGNIFSAVPSVKGFSKIDNPSTVTASSIMSRVDALANAISQGYRLTAQGDKINYSSQEIAQLNKLYNDIFQGLRQLDSATQNQLNKTYVDQVKIKSGPMAGQMRSQWFGSSRLKASDQLTAIIEKINWAVAVGTGTTNVDKGILFEYCVPAAVLACKNLSTEALKKAIEESILANNKTAVQYDTRIFDSNLNPSNFIPKNYTKVNDVLYEFTTLPSKDKVDVRLELIPGKNPINLSLKNANLTGLTRRPVSIVSDAPLLAILSTLNNADFVNHFLNQHAHAAGYNYTAMSLHGIYQETNKIMTLTLLEKALRGYKDNTMKANVFVINDNISGTVRVYNMGDIIQKFMDNLDAMSMNYLDLTPDITSLWFANPWAPSGYEARIENLLAAVAKTHITLKLQPELFTSNIL